MLHLDSLSQKIINWNPPEDAHFLDQQSREQEHDILHSNHGTITSLDPSDFITSIPSSPDSANPIHSSPLSPLTDPPTNSSATFSQLHQPTLQHLNPHMALAEEKEAPLEIIQREEEEEDDSAVSPIQRLAQSASSSAPPINADRPDSSRLSTPLSELSPPPDDEVLDTISASNTVNGAGHEGGRDVRPDDCRSALFSEKMVGGRNGFSVDASESSREHNSSVSSALLARANGDHFMSTKSHTPSMLPNLSTPPTHLLSMPPQAFDTSLGTSPSSSMNPVHPSATTTNSQDPRAVTILELNVELLKICMFLQSKGIGSTDPQFQQFATRIQSNLAYLATIAEANRTGTTFALPILEPFPAVDPSLVSNPHLANLVERIRQTYKDLPTIFAKDVVRRQSMNASIGMGMLPGHAPTQNLAAAGGNPAHTTSPPNHLKRERQEELGFVENGVSAKRRDTGEGKALSPPGFASGPKNQHHQGQMMPPPSIPVSNSGGMNAMSVRVTSPANGPLTFSLPMPSGAPSMGQHQAQQHGQQHGNEQGHQKRQPSVPPPAPTRTPTPRTPSAGASHLSPPLARHPSLPPTPTTTSPPRSSQQHLHFGSSNHAANSSGQPNNASNSMASNTMHSSSAPNDMLNLPNFGINATEAQLAAVNRERMRQMQIKVAQQQAHAQQMRLAGPTGHGANMGMGMGGAGMGGNVGLGGGMIPANSAGSGGGMAAGGMGMSMSGMGMGMGDMLPPGANPRMMPQQHQPHTGGMEAANAMSPPHMNLNVNQLVGPSGMAMGGMGGMQAPAGMGGGMNMGGMGSMSQGTAGGMGVQGAMSGGPVQGAASQQQHALLQQLYTILRNPNHPTMKFMLQTVPGFESMPTNMQLQKLMNARNVQIQRQEQQQLAAQQAAGQMNQISGMRPPLSNTMQPSQQQHTNMSGMGNGMGSGIGPSGMGNVMSGSSGMGGSGMNTSMMGQQSQQTNVGGMSPVQSQFAPQSMMGMGGMGAGMDPRMNANMAATGLTPQQRNMLLAQQHQRMASGMHGGGMGSAQFNNMGGAGNVPSMALHPQMVQERMRQQQQQQQAHAQANRMSGRASSPPHVASPLGSDGGFPVPSSATSAAAPMRSGTSIPGIARSTRSPTDAPSPIATRGPQTRMPSMGQDDYQRILFQQQQQAIRSMSTASPAFNQQMMRNSPPHQQLAAQMQHQQHQQQQHQQQHQQQAYGMSGFSASAPNFGGVTGGMNASSPTSSQNWSTPSHGGYPFSPPSDQRHMTATPVPQQPHHQTQMAPQSSSPQDPSLYDLFTWNG